MVGKCQDEARLKDAKKERKRRERCDGWRRNKVMNAILTTGAIESTTSGDVADVVEEMENVERSSGGDVAEEVFSACGSKLGLFAGGNALEERDATDWVMDDEMMRQW